MAPLAPVLPAPQLWPTLPIGGERSAARREHRHKRLIRGPSSELMLDEQAITELSAPVLETPVASAR